jgi:hypothetical protein
MERRMAILVRKNISTDNFVQKNKIQIFISTIVSAFIILSACFQVGTYYLEVRKEKSQQKENTKQK